MDVVISYFKLLLAEKSRLLQYGQANFSVHLIDEGMNSNFIDLMFL